MIIRYDIGHQMLQLGLVGRTLDFMKANIIGKALMGSFVVFSMAYPGRGGDGGGGWTLHES